MADILNQQQLQGLKVHKYKAEGASIVEPFMQVFWQWLVQQIPLWWAPNAITLIGLIANISTTSFLIYYSPDVAQTVPEWTCLLTGLGLFFYQSLDAIDGKQARRTNSATPLGELFDHGCDAVSTVFVVTGCCISAKVGQYPEIFFLLAFSYMLFFYVAHWQTYCTGTLKFGMVDVTEGQHAIMLIHFISCYFGSDVWDTKVFGLELKLLPCMLCFVSGLVSCMFNLRTILFEGGAGKHGSTVAETSVISPAIPIGLLIMMCYYIHKWSPLLFINHPVLFVITWGAVSAKITCKLVLAHMSCSEMDLLDVSHLGPLFMLINQYFDCPFSEYFLLWMALFYSWADLIVYCVRVCKKICEHLNICCFSILPPQQSATGKGGPMSSTTPQKSSQRNPPSTSVGQPERRK